MVVQYSRSRSISPTLSDLEREGLAVYAFLLRTLTGKTGAAMYRYVVVAYEFGANRSIKRLLLYSNRPAKFRNTFAGRQKDPWSASISTNYIH